MAERFHTKNGAKLIAETTRGHDEMWFRKLAHKIADILE